MMDDKKIVQISSMPPADPFCELCPSRTVLQHVTNKWGALVMVALMQKTHRFSELRKKIGGVSEKMLAQTLQSLEQDGLVSRHSYPVVPPHVEYSLTEIGREVGEKLEALLDVIRDRLPDMLASSAAQ